MPRFFRHPNKNVYELLDKDVIGKSGKKWEDGVIYQCFKTKKKFWTTKERFERRFSEISGLEVLKLIQN